MAVLRRFGRALYDQPSVLLVFTALAWGGNTVASRLAVGEASPMVVVCLRWLVVLVVLAVVARGPVAADWRTLAPRWPYLLVLGALGFTGFNALFYVAGHYTTAINLGLIQGVVPAVVLGGSFLAYRDPVRWIQVLGLLVAGSGVVVATSRGDLAILKTLAFNVGDLLIVLASFLYAGYTIALRRRPSVQPLAFFTGLAIAAFVSSLPLLAWEVATEHVIWPSLAGWAIIVFVALIPSLVAQLTFMRGVELIGPGRAGLFVNLIPIFAALLGVVILDEAFAVYHAVALSLVLGGIWLAERARPVASQVA
jgi:drug/metabolite transporter (DMT)-like permease